MLNRIMQPLPDVPYDAAAIRTVDLEQGLYTQGFLLTIQGQYLIAAGGGAATTCSQVRWSGRLLQRPGE